MGAIIGIKFPPSLLVGVPVCLLLLYWGGGNGADCLIDSTGDWVVDYLLCRL